MKAVRVFPTLVGLALVVGARGAFYLLRPLYADLGATERVWVNLALAWGVTLVLLAVIRFWERQPLSSIGMQGMTGRDVLWALGGFLLGGAIIMLTMPLMGALGLRTTEGGVRRLAQFPVWIRVLMVVTAGITEEIRYRGYLVERISALTRSLAVGTAVSYVIFFLVHLPFWGLGGAIQIGLGSVVLYALYLKRRNLPACMLMHGLNDAVALLLVPAFLPNR